MHVHYDITGWLGVALNLTLAGIIFAYLVIAWQFWHRRNGDRRARQALNQLIAIFVLCSFCGYLPRLLHFPTWLLAALHFALLICAWAYVAARQADSISDALRRAEDHDDGVV
jgi:heme A synthase